MKEWNTVAALACVITLVYVGTATAALFVGKIQFPEYSTAVLPVLTAWGGYLAALLPKGAA